MADWSWKQAVAKYVLQIVNRKSSPSFTLSELYAYTKELSRLFPRNKNIRPKIRQILQRLRDADGFLVFLGEGHYSLNLEYEELEGDPVLSGQEGLESPVTKRMLRNVRLRNTFLATEMKCRYGNLCQVCREPVILSENTFYAEAHHLRPLGAPHLGPDNAGNIVVLCPNHHALFDRRVVTIVPDSLLLRHRLEGIFRRKARLHIEPWHELNPKYLKYHHRLFCESHL